MSRIVVLVNGLPGSGKTTLGRGLAAVLGLPLLRRDAIRDTYVEILGQTVPEGRRTREWRHALGAAAGEALWTLLADSPVGAVLESQWLAHLRPVATAGLRRAGVEHPLEVWCDVPVAVARERYEMQVFEALPDQGVLPATDDEWRFWMTVAEPLGLGPVRRVNTVEPVDLEAIAAWAREEADATAGSSPV